MRLNKHVVSAEIQVSYVFLKLKARS